MHTITAMFARYADASEAVTRLKAAGIPDRDISLISNDATERGRTKDEYRKVEHDSQAGGGAAIGGALGGGAGLLAGLGLLAIPGLGPVVAAGWLASTLAVAGAGALAGGLVGSMIDAGVSEEDAHLYAEGIRRGHTLVTVRCDDAQSAKVADILDDEGTIEMDKSAEAWRGEGWSGRYAGDPTATRPTNPVTPSSSSVPASRARVRTYATPTNDRDRP